MFWKVRYVASQTCVWRLQNEPQTFSKNWVVTCVPVLQLRCLSRLSISVGQRQSRTVTLFTVSLPTNTVVACRQLLFCCADSTYKRTNSFSAKQTRHLAPTPPSLVLKTPRDLFVWWWMSQSVWFRTKLLQDVCASVCSLHTQVCEATYRTFQNTKRFQKRTNNDEGTFVYVHCQNWLFKVWEFKYRPILIRS